MARKTVKTLHPLAMADALTMINERAGLLIATISTVCELSADMGADQLRASLKRIETAAGDLRAGIWPDDDTEA